MGAKVSSNSVLFPKGLSKRVEVKFDTEAMSSDGGAVLLVALDRGLALTQAVLPAFVDQRDSSRVTHPYVDLLRQRVYGLALGYEDCNDAERIGGDAAVKLAVGRGLKAPNLASASTLCRFENGVSARELATAGRALARWRVATLRKRFRKARLVTIDVDSTPDLRERLFKLAVRIEESVRRFVLHCPIDFPWLHEWQQAALSIGAVRC